MKVKRALGCISLLIILGLSGCGKESIRISEDYDASAVTSVKMDLTSWQLKIMVSSDENIHVSMYGTISDKEAKPVTELQEETLNIQQSDAGEQAHDQLALGKKGEITVYLPTDFDIPIEVINRDGEVEVNGISTSRFAMINASGYVTISGITAEELDITSASGDIKILDSNIPEIHVEAASGYVSLKQTVFGNGAVETKSGEVTMSGVSTDTNLDVNTGSGDISITYKASPQNLTFNITAVSKDISARLKDAKYTKETTACKQGVIGNGVYVLGVRSDSGTVIIR